MGFCVNAKAFFGHEVHMELFEELLQEGLALILFCVGVTVLILQFNDYRNLVEEVRGLHKEVIIREEKKLDLSQLIVDDKDQVVSRGELISYLLHQLEYQIEIDGVKIHKTENIRGMIMSYEFHSEYYQKGYRYDENGAIESILFFGMTPD